MSSMNPNAESSETKAKSGTDLSAHQGGDSSVDLQDPNKSKTVSSDDNNLNETNKENEEDCDECSLSRFLKKGGCKDAFEESVQFREVKNDGTSCLDGRLKLNTCMYAFVDYYGQYLAMQKAMLTQSLKELEKGEEAAAAAKKKEEEETKVK
ncbi:PREDICTED: uncharacterized protein LOC104783485 [Camelina sativa]|uniref:Uncharacterized protein LOC104783485 n=1 Tax=Camelina sativa TaxID=90675 RepID=A0ABM0YWK9_CAMSA|nr:PREDICTED: uncharacterized protein LOC104783485 [Camelina sativa]